MQYIKKIKLINFKRFKDLEVNFNPGINTLIGDNESGKSSILQAIGLVASGSRNKVDTIGIESLLNKSSVDKFLESEKKFTDLPKIHVEVHVSDDSKLEFVGKNNCDNDNVSGLQMICQPNEELSGEIKKILAEEDDNFPFEFYVVNFTGFSGTAYSTYQRFLKCLTIDNSQISSEYANKEYIKTVYDSTVDSVTRYQLKNQYRQQKGQFTECNLKDINEKLDDFDFEIRSGSKSNLETDIVIVQNKIPIDERGKGYQCFIKTEFALTRNSDKRRPIDALLLEEPENHLSHTNMKRLISKIENAYQNQIIIATHSSLISTGLDLRNSILLNSSDDNSITLEDLEESTAKFFMKAPNNNILEFALSTKVILVEGPAEYILLGDFYSKETGRSLDEDAVHVISVGGTSFKRYMELAKILKNKVAIIRDNDKNYQSNCVDNYEGYTSENIKVFSDEDNQRHTFEVCMYEDNQSCCDALFFERSRKKDTLTFMLNNKTESAFCLVDEEEKQLEVPDYIKKAIAWISG